MEPKAGRPKRRGRCYRGHEMTPENTYTYPSGKTDCRECCRDRWKIYYKRRRKTQSVRKKK